MLSVTVKIGQNLCNSAHNSGKSHEQHPFSFPYPDGFSILLNLSSHCFTASQASLASFPKTLKSHFLEVRKMFPLIQNKSYPPLLLLGHLSNEAIKNPISNFFCTTVEKPHMRRNFMDNISNFLYALPNCTIYLTQPVSKNTHLLHALKLDMQFFSRCCNWFGSWWLPLSTVTTYCKSSYLQGCMSLKWHKIYYLRALFIIKKINSQNYKLTRSKSVSQAGLSAFIIF